MKFSARGAMTWRPTLSVDPASFDRMVKRMREKFGADVFGVPVYH